MQGEFLQEGTQIPSFLVLEKVFNIAVWYTYKINRLIFLCYINMNFEDKVPKFTKGDTVIFTKEKPPIVSLSLEDLENPDILKEIINISKQFLDLPVKSGWVNTYSEVIKKIQESGEFEGFKYLNKGHIDQAELPNGKDFIGSEYDSNKDSYMEDGKLVTLRHEFYESPESTDSYCWAQFDVLKNGYVFVDITQNTAESSVFKKDFFRDQEHKQELIYLNKFLELTKIQNESYISQEDFIEYMKKIPEAAKNIDEQVKKDFADTVTIE